MKHASDNTPRKGETVSDVSGLSGDIYEIVAREVSETQMLLNKATTASADVDDIQVRVKEARARLELVERATEKREDGDVS
jgi:DNA-binding transcriptional regulator GbsR (MarR family)